MFQKVPEPVALLRALPSGNQLHGRIDQKRIRQRLQFQPSRLSCVMMIRPDTVQPHSCQRSRQSSDRDVGRVLIELVVPSGQVVFDVTISGEKHSGSHEGQRVPPPIRGLERRLVKLSFSVRFTARATMP